MRTDKILAPVPAQIADAGKVHIGGWSPGLPQPVIRPVPKEVADAGKVHMGGWSPSL